MSTNPSYLQSAADGQVKNYRDWGIAARPPLPCAQAVVPDPRAGGRQPAGAAAPRSRERAVARRAGVGHGALARAGARCRCRRSACATSRRDSTGEALDRHTLAWAERINRSGAAYLTPAMLDGRWMVRVSIGAEQTERRHVEEVWALMRAGGGARAKDGSRVSLREPGDLGRRSQSRRLPDARRPPAIYV